MTGEIIGHDDALETLRQALNGTAMPHAWLFAGPPGIGKATIARQFARALLSNPAAAKDAPLPFDRQTGLLFEANGHPDFAVLERLEKKQKGSEETKKARGIGIEQVRGLSRLLNMASSMGGRRVVMIDAADELEMPAANALLKNLEEPPSGVVFLLVSHSPGRLLPTIRSRCRLLRFRPLDRPAMARALDLIAPDLGPAERAALIREAEGAPGRAAQLLGLDLAGLNASVALISAGGESGRREAARLAAALAPAAAQERLAAFIELAQRNLADRARGASPDQRGAALARWEEAQRLGEGAIVPYQLEPGALVTMLCRQLADAGDRPGAGR